MREINDFSIAVLVLGLFLIAVTIFLALVGLQSNIKQRLLQCFLGTLYVLVLVSIAICKEENHWVDAEVHNVKVRVWASDLKDSRANIGVHLGLKGVNITLEIKDKPVIAYNELFEWAWGTKNSMEDGSNSYKRTLRSAVNKGLPLPIQDLAESFETYGILGAASPGLGLHEAGFYTNLCLTIALGAWIITGLLPPLSLYASFYASLSTVISLTLASLIYIAIFFTSSVQHKSARYYQKWDEDEREPFNLLFTWCFFLNILVAIISGILTYCLRRYANKAIIIQLHKLQQEIRQDEETAAEREKSNLSGRSSSSRSRSLKQRAFRAKRRLTAHFSNRSSDSAASECKDNANDQIIAVLLSDVQQTQNHHGKRTEQKICMQAKDVMKCDIEYTGPDSTMVYGIASAPEGIARDRLTPPEQIFTRRDQGPQRLRVLGLPSSEITEITEDPLSDNESSKRA